MQRISGVRVGTDLGRLGKTQGWLAKKTGLDKNTISEIIKAGALGSWRHSKTVSAIAEALGVGEEALLVPDGGPPDGGGSATPATEGSVPADPTATLVALLGHLPETNSTVFGRERELALLDELWAQQERGLAAGTRVVVFVAGPGVGKSSVVNAWLRRMERDSYRGAEQVLAWSFYNQGSESGEQTPAEMFLEAALRRLGEPFTGTNLQRAERLAQQILKKRTLLVLDGLEPLQGRRDEEGRVQDKAMRYLLRELATAGSGLCVVTTRIAVADLRDLEPGAVYQKDIENLSNADGAALLRDGGVKGSDLECRRAAAEFGGHCMALTLLASYLSDKCGGVVTARDTIGPLMYDARRGGHARRVMESCATWLDERELSVMRLLGLFDRPAEKAAVDALKAAPPIPALTEHLEDLGAQAWGQVVSRLRRLRLIHETSPQHPTSLDTHPLIREYFREQLRTGHEQSWVDANRILFEHFKEVADPLPDTIAGMEPLFRATVYGCNAGLHRRALHEVFVPRIMRGDKSYATEVLRALGSVLHALSHFFETREFERPVGALAPADQRIVLTEAALCLTAAKGYAAPEAEACYQRALTLANRPADLKRRFVITHGLSLVYRVGGALSRSMELARQLQEMAAKMPAGDRATYTSAAQRAVATNLFYCGEFQAVKREARRGVVRLDRRRTLVAARQFINDPAIGCAGYISLADWFLGDAPAASSQADTAVERADALGHAHTLVTTLLIQAMIAQFCGDRAAARVASERMGEICGTHGFRLWELASELVRGWAVAGDQVGDAVVRQMELSVEAWTAMGASLFMPYWLGLTAEVQRRFGRNRDAYLGVKRAIGVARDTGETWWLAELLRLQGELMMLVGAPGTEAEVVLREAGRISAKQGARLLAQRVKDSLRLLPGNRVAVDAAGAAETREGRARAR
jgi:predicted ATPase